MKKFEVQATDDGMFRVVRWNELTQCYEPLGRKKYRSSKLAEFFAQKAQEMYNVENRAEVGSKDIGIGNAGCYSKVEQTGCYKTFLEKERFFQEERVDSIAELNKLISELGGDTSLRFRGVKEAKYTMLSSLQRNGRGRDFFATLLMAVKDDQRIQKYSKDQSIDINDMSCMSLMQHYGLPTPLLDFTTDINVALGFAATDVSQDAKNDWETEKYVSLYYFSLYKESEMQNNLQSVLNNDMENGLAYACEYKNTEGDIDTHILDKIDDFITWEDLSVIEMIFVENPTWAERVRTKKGEELETNNLNLSKQKGCFVLNNYRIEEMPLEENWYKRTSECRNNYHQNTDNDIDTPYPFSGIMTNRKIHCVDIKKDVIIQWTNENPMELYDKSTISEEIGNVLQKIKESVDND